MIVIHQELRRIWRRWQVVILIMVIALIALVGCSGDSEIVATPTLADPTSLSAPTIELPATNELGTAEANPPTAVGTSPAVGPAAADDDFLAIDEILSEIDNDVCQNAYQTQLELEAMIAEGVDVAELEAAVAELIEELESCPTPTP